jgi:hypothetical protein
LSEEKMDPCTACGALWPAAVSTGPTPFDVTVAVPEDPPCSCTAADREVASLKKLAPLIESLFKPLTK